MTLMKKVIKDFKRNTIRPYHKPEATPKRTTYGQIAGIEPGTVFESRKACADAGVHGVLRQGIHASQTGAYSVCLSGIYEDNKDDGDFFLYTGSGGKVDPSSKSSKHVVDQSFTNPYNRSLKMSVLSRRPVRVVRREDKNSKWAPTNGYRYDGLYRVVKAYLGRNKSGHYVCKFEFQRLPGQPLLPVKSMGP